MYLGVKEYQGIQKGYSTQRTSGSMSPIHAAKAESPINLSEKPPDDYYRNRAGDIVAIIRTAGPNDNFYTIDNAGNVTLDGSRQRNVPFTSPGGAVLGGNPSWQALTDNEKNAIFNLVDFEQDRAMNTKYMRNRNGLKPSFSEALVNAGLTNNSMVGGGVASSFRNGVLGPGGSQLLEVYDTGYRKIWVTAASPLNPSTAPGSPLAGGLPASQPLPTPAAGVTQPLLPGTTFQPGQTKVIDLQNPTPVNLTDAAGNLVPVDFSSPQWKSRPWVFGPISR